MNRPNRNRRVILIFLFYFKKGRFIVIPIPRLAPVIQTTWEEMKHEKRQSHLFKTRGMKHSNVCVSFILLAISSISWRLGCFLDIKVKSADDKSKRELESEKKG